VVIVEGEGAVLGGGARESLGLSIVTSGIVCVMGGEAAFPKLLWVFSCYMDKAHCAAIFAIAQLSCLLFQLLPSYSRTVFGLPATQVMTSYDRFVTNSRVKLSQ